MGLVDTSSPDSRLHQSRKRVFPRHPCFEPVLSCCLCQCCTHNLLAFLSLYFAHGSGVPGFSVLIHGSTSCRQLKSCLRDWSISRIMPCRLDNDKGHRSTCWQRPNNVSSSYPQEAVHPDNWSHRHAHSRQAEDVHGSAIGMDNLAIHVQGIRVRSASEDEGSLRPLLHGESQRLWSTVT